MPKRPEKMLNSGIKDTRDRRHIKGQQNIDHASARGRSIIKSVEQGAIPNKSMLKELNNFLIYAENGSPKEAAKAKEILKRIKE